MHIKLDIGVYRAYFAITRYTKIKGVCSNLPDSNHVLLWDFDDITEVDVTTALKAVQKKWKLSRIYLINTGLPTYWHAYCFKSVDFATMLHILADTKGVDRVYLSIGMLRGYFTLRYQPKENRPFQPAIVLPSKVKEDVSPFTLNSVLYFTKRR